MSWFDTSNIRGHTSGSRPIISQIICTGTWAAISSTNSTSPFSHTLSMTIAARRSISSMSERIIRGVNPFDTRRRYRLCLGGSIMRIVRRRLASASSSAVGMNAPPSSEEYTALLCDTERTSACFVTAQKPVSFGSSCQNTGASRRSRSNWSCGS